MRKALLGLAGLALGLAFSSVTAQAQTTITLTGGSCATCFDFAVAGSSVTMTMTPTSISSVAVTLGGTLPIPTITTFTLSESAPILLTNMGGGNYTVAAGSGGFNIVLSDGGGFTLDGFLSIQNLSQSAASGTIDTTVVANFNITGGTYCTLPGNNCGVGAGYGKVFLTLATDPIAGGSHGGLSGGSIVMPAENTAVTPEPSSMLLYGTGLVVFGGILRRRFSA